MTVTTTLINAALKFVEQARETLVPIIKEDNQRSINIMTGLTVAADELEVWLDGEKNN